MKRISEEEEDEQADAEPESNAKILVAYFSATGTAKTLAEYAADAMAADLYEIIPEEPYIDEDLDYGNDQSRSSLEIWTFEALETHYKTLVRYLNRMIRGWCWDMDAEQCQ